MSGYKGSLTTRTMVLRWVEFCPDRRDAVQKRQVPCGEIHVRGTRVRRLGGREESQKEVI